MGRLSRRRMDLRKLSNYSVVINSIQILAALTVLTLAVIRGSDAFSGRIEQIVLAVLSSIVVFGAGVDIYDARSARRISDESDRLEQAYGQLAGLNGTLRAQRHDFMNHLQVVYSLIEMEDHEEAQAYMEKVYADIQRVSRALKTSIPALNALLASKLSECEDRDVTAVVDIRSAYEGMPIPDWELCRVFSNLIDNALDAMKDSPRRCLEIRTTETLHSFEFEVANTGPKITGDQMSRIFAEGFSTKGENRGMGLAIVKSILSEYSARIEVATGDERTCFSGVIPKQ